MYLSSFVILSIINEIINKSQFLKSVHNCVYFLTFLIHVHCSIMCKAYSIQNVLIVVINDWEFNCIEYTESAELKWKKIKG